MSISRTLSRLRHFNHISDNEYFELMQMKKENKQLHKALENIKAEIETDMSWFCFDDWGNEITEWTEIKRIIDKHISGKEQT